MVKKEKDGWRTDDSGLSEEEEEEKIKRGG